MKNVLIFTILMVALTTCCACGRNENPFYAVSDQQQSAKKIVDDVQNIKQYALQQQQNEIKNIEETR